ncbi:MAG TPA: hypothetical protein ENN30_01555, partial [Candidatus Woesearchaeota archaeon]|nr:hypothetical protein [Candidatus Woesearchaeota archaeon]
MVDLRYSKKVMKHFLKPKNFGEIKNADVIGSAGNPYCGDLMEIYLKIKDNKIYKIKFKTLGCLPKNEKVLVGNGDWVDISTISVGDTVLNGNGEPVKVKEVYKKKTKSKLIKIVPFVSKYNSFCVTPAHPVLCIKRDWVNSSRKNSKCLWLRVAEKELINTTPGYVEAELLENGDYILFSKRRELKDNPVFTKRIMRF